MIQSGEIRVIDSRPSIVWISLSLRLSSKGQISRLPGRPDRLVYDPTSGVWW